MDRSEISQFERTTSFDIEKLIDFFFDRKRGITLRSKKKKKNTTTIHQRTQRLRYFLLSCLSKSFFVIVNIFLFTSLVNRLKNIKKRFEFLSSLLFSFFFLPIETLNFLFSSLENEMQSDFSCSQSSFEFNCTLLFPTGFNLISNNLTFVDFRKRFLFRQTFIRMNLKKIKRSLIQHLVFKIVYARSIRFMLANRDFSLVNVRKNQCHSFFRSNTMIT